MFYPGLCKPHCLCPRCTLGHRQRATDRDVVIYAVGSWKLLLMNWWLWRSGRSSGTGNRSKVGTSGAIKSQHKHNTSNLKRWPPMVMDSRREWPISLLFQRGKCYKELAGILSSSTEGICHWFIKVVQSIRALFDFSLSLSDLVPSVMKNTFLPPPAF